MYFVSSVQGNRFRGIFDFSVFLETASSSSLLSASAGGPSNPLKSIDSLYPGEDNITKIHDIAVTKNNDQHLL